MVAAELGWTSTGDYSLIVFLFWVIGWWRWNWAEPIFGLWSWLSSIRQHPFSFLVLLSLWVSEKRELWVKEKKKWRRRSDKERVGERDVTWWDKSYGWAPRGQKIYGNATELKLSLRGENRKQHFAVFGFQVFHSTQTEFEWWKLGEEIKPNTPVFSGSHTILSLSDENRLIQTEPKSLSFFHLFPRFSHLAFFWIGWLVKIFMCIWHSHCNLYFFFY